MSEEKIMINKSIIFIIGALVTLISVVASVVAFSVTTKESADNALNIANECIKTSKKHQEIMAQNRQDIAIINTQYSDIIRRLEIIDKKLER